MKKYIFILFTSMLSFILLSGCNKKEVPSISSIHTLASGKTDLYESASQLENSASVIVKVQKISDENVLQSSSSNHPYGYTLSNVTITNIYKNTSHQTLNINDTIPIYENQFFYEDDDGNTVTCHVNRYNKMNNNREYILYLKYSEDDSWYYILGVTFGKINVDMEEPSLVPADSITLYNGQSYDNSNRQFEDNLMKQIQEEVLNLYQ